jgi:hypothetical protein
VRHASPLETAIVFGLALTAAFVTWMREHASAPERFLVLFLVLGGSVALVARWIGTRRSDPEPAPDRLADVAGLRIALDASVAPSLVAALSRALTEPEHRRLQRIAELLLEARPQWRLAALDATQPLPEPKARKLFDAWADDVRKRFVPRASLVSDDYRTSSLLVVCLHVETSEEIRDASGPGDEAVERTLRQLAYGQRLTVRRVDLWSSSEPLSATDLATIDHTLQPVSS